MDVFAVICESGEFYLFSDRQEALEYLDFANDHDFECNWEMLKMAVYSTAKEVIKG